MELSRVIDGTLVILVASSMLAPGLRERPGRLKAAVSRRAEVSLLAAVNILMVPAMAALIVAILDVGDQIALGIMLVAIAPGSPLAPRLTELAREMQLSPWHSCSVSNS